MNIGLPRKIFEVEPAKEPAEQPSAVPVPEQVPELVPVPVGPSREE